MATVDTAIDTRYFKGIMGEVADPLATIVDFSLLVHPTEHTVTGTVKINVGTTKETYTGKVSGSTYVTGLGKSVRLINIHGNIPNNNPLTPLLFPFEAHMSLDAEWNGKGGFTFQGKHHEDVPVTSTVFNLQSAAN